MMGIDRSMGVLKEIIAYLLFAPVPEELKNRRLLH